MGAFELVLTGIMVAAVLAATYAFAGRLSQRRVERDFEDPDEIITAANVYVKYRRQRAAIHLLEAGLERHPEHAGIRRLLDELRAQGDSA